MFARFGRPSHPTVVAYAALFVALGGVSYAAITLPDNSVGSKQIKRGAVKNSDLGKSAVTTGKVKDGSLLSTDFKPGQLLAGAPGATGLQGPQGPQGATGPAGSNGSPDTPAQVLSKLGSVDGSGSGLDADLVDGRTSSEFIGRGFSSATGQIGTNWYAYFMNTSATTDYTFGQMKLRTTGVAGEFRVCNILGSTGSYVVYLNGVRFASVLSAGTCTGAFDAGAGGDFQVSMRRSIIFGVHSGDTTANENYAIYGFGQL